ncbi:hypothetical protein KKA09_03375 [Patescibacteria group bacterium]|nr:hypothetical protein [Patescibacteria group bacterium]
MLRRASAPIRGISGLEILHFAYKKKGDNFIRKDIVDYVAMSNSGNYRFIFYI